MVVPTLTEFCKAHRLSPNEARMVGMIINGFSNKMIAAHMAIKEQVVKNALGEVYFKVHIEGPRVGKRIHLLLAVNRWLAEEKRKRVRERMNV